MFISESAADYVPNLSTAAQRGFDLVVAVGFLMAESTSSVAKRFPGTSFAIVDVSANRTTLELRGQWVRELLEFGCSLDLHPRAFGPGRCAQTLLARANVLIWFVSDEPEPVYRVLVRPSFAAYVAAWLADAADGLID